MWVEILSSAAGIVGALATEGLKVWKDSKALEAQNRALEIQERISATELEKVRISTQSQVQLELAKVSAETDRAVLLQDSEAFGKSLEHDIALGKEVGFSGFLRKSVRPWITLQWNWIAGYLVLQFLPVMLQSKDLQETIVNGFVALWLTTSTWWFTNRMLDVRKSNGAV
jgi:hypothetical protein